MFVEQAVLCDTPAGRIGMTICYDLRFPELYQKLTWEHGAHILTVPSAFTKITGGLHSMLRLLLATSSLLTLAVTVKAVLTGFAIYNMRGCMWHVATRRDVSHAEIIVDCPLAKLRALARRRLSAGEAHWEVLLRARAIENQAYVIAAAQAGKHNEKRESYGHSLIIDPWGTVIAKLQDPLETGIAIAEIDLEKLNAVRLKMPILEHRAKGHRAYRPELVTPK